ncbi:adenylate/guanylate cyclase domain-containing protein, partial [Gemmatimonadota bacterium]
EKEGRIVKFIGDAALAIFDSTDLALQGALEFREAFGESEIVQDLQSKVSMGLHIGEVFTAEDGDVYGDGVNVASRVQGEAKPGQLLLSQAARDMVKGRGEYDFISVGSYALKGVDEPMRLFAAGDARPEGEGEEGKPPAQLSTALGMLVKGRGLPGIGLVLAASWIIGTFLDFGGAQSLEAYAIAWASITAAIWFLFDKTEAAVSEETRHKLATWMKSQDLGQSLAAIPSSFIVIFDRIFGERHLTWKCFYRSCFASLVTVLIAFAIWFALKPQATNLLLHRDSLINFAWLVLLSGLFNFIPDYLSLLETRYVLKWMDRSGRVGSYIILDAVFTSAISAGLIYLAVIFVYGSPIFPGSFLGAWASLAQVSDYFGEVGFFLNWEGETARGSVAMPLGIFYYSAFMTSIWIWLYLLAWIVARGLLSVGGGISFLLRVTDVERYPIRSMGYVSVMVITAVFILGLPLFVL